jgi:DNA-binding transcriptional LysR family regulator
METRELRYFVALAEELHFTRAAARVGIEQSPLSRAISELERNLGVRLFVRTRRSTTLTSVGAVLLKDARRILAEVDQARRNVIAAASGCSGQLRIAVCGALAHPKIARLLAQSRAEDPDVDIQIVDGTFQDQMRGLRSGVVDVGFGLSASNEEGVRSVPLWRDSIVSVIRPDHRLSEQRSIRQIDALILLGRELPDCAMTDSLLHSVVRNYARIEYAASVELLLTMVAAGYGVGIMSAAHAEAIRRTDVVVRPLGARRAWITTFMLQRSESPSKVAARFTERAQKMV